MVVGVSWPHGLQALGTQEGPRSSRLEPFNIWGQGRFASCPGQGGVGTQDWIECAVGAIGYCVLAFRMERAHSQRQECCKDPVLGVKSKGLSQMGRGALGTSYCAHHVKFWGFEAQRKGLACREKLRDLRRIHGS